MEDLITYYRQIFEDPGASSPPLPPTPATEPVPQYYGSKNTKVGTVPPMPEVNDQGSPQDFTPRLPPRPVSSIHPSSRTHGNNTSPQKPRPNSQLPPLPTEEEEDQDSSDDDDDDDVDIPSSPSPTTAHAKSQSADGVDTPAPHSRNSSENTRTSQESNRPATPLTGSQKLYPFPVTSTPDGSPTNANTNMNANTNVNANVNTTTNADVIANTNGSNSNPANGNGPAQ